MKEDELNYCKKHHHSYVTECVDCYREQSACIHGVPFDSECGEREEDAKIVKACKERSTRPKVAHYQSGGIEPIDYINSHNFNFNRGCVIKYVSRAGLKDKSKEIEDLQKAIDYLNFEIERVNNVEA